MAVLRSLCRAAGVLYMRVYRWPCAGSKSGCWRESEDSLVVTGSCWCNCYRYLRSVAHVNTVSPAHGCWGQGKVYGTAAAVCVVELSSRAYH